MRHLNKIPETNAGKIKQQDIPLILHRYEVRLDDSGPSLEDEAVEYQNLESEVKFLLELRNMTEWRLWPDQTYIHWGYITSPPTG